MSRFFKRMIRSKKQSDSDHITNYLISEIEDIVSKKICGASSHKSLQEDKDNYRYSKNKVKEKYNDNSYTTHINYALKEEQPFRAVRYIDEDTHKTFLPFEEREIKPQVYNEEQIRSIVRKTLKPALNQWLDENLDIIIEKAIKKKI